MYKAIWKRNKKTGKAVWETKVMKTSNKGPKLSITIQPSPHLSTTYKQAGGHFSSFFFTLPYFLYFYYYYSAVFYSGLQPRTGNVVHTYSSSSSWENFIVEERRDREGQHGPTIRLWSLVSRWFAIILIIQVGEEIETKWCCTVTTGFVIYSSVIYR